MAGYANRLIKLDFPDLSEEGDLVHVIIRNPKTLPAGELLNRDVLAAAKNGEEDTAQQIEAMYPMLARLVQAWHVYDGTVDGDDLPLLPLPATAESVAKLPFEIVQVMIERFTEVVAPS